MVQAIFTVLLCRILCTYFIKVYVSICRAYHIEIMNDINKLWKFQQINVSKISKSD